MSRIFITGDTHADFRRFSVDNFPIQKELCKDDIMIILGDFGGIWNRSSSKNEQYWLDWLANKNFSIAFIDGNHENFTRLYSYPVEEWYGGKTHVIRPSLRHLMRGEVFIFNNKTFLAMGGNTSHDIKDGILDPSEPNFKEEYKRLQQKPNALYRIKGISWWPEEMPTEDELANAENNLRQYNNIVDYILAHSAPKAATAALGFTDYNKLEQMWDVAFSNGLRCRHTMFSGHYHIDTTLWGIRFMYGDIIELECDASI